MGQSGQSKTIKTNHKSKQSVKSDLPSLSDDLVTFGGLWSIKQIGSLTDCASTLQRKRCAHCDWFTVQGNIYSHNLD